jgi:hypothetical protein
MAVMLRRRWDVLGVRGGFRLESAAITDGDAAVDPPGPPTNDAAALAPAPAAIAGVESADVPATAVCVGVGSLSSSCASSSNSRIFTSDALRDPEGGVDGAGTVSVSASAVVVAGVGSVSASVVVVRAEPVSATIVVVVVSTTVGRTGSVDAPIANTSID